MFKQLIKPIAAGAVLMMCGGAAQAVELCVTNCGFEDGTFNGWTQFVAGPTETIVSPGAYGTSSFAARLALAGGPSDAVIKAANLGVGIITPFSTVTIQFDAMGSNADGGVLFAEFFSELSGGGTSKSELLGGAPLFAIPQGAGFNPVTWTHFTFIVTTGSDVSGGVTLQLKSSCGAAASCISDNSWDNASVAVPVPAAVWLFGSALGVVSVMRRKIAA